MSDRRVLPARNSLVIGCLVILLILGRPPDQVAACTGETPSLGSVTSTARVIVQLEVIQVSPVQLSEGVPSSFTARVDRVLKGPAPALMTFNSPTLIGICDGYIATMGDRFVMAIGSRPFPQGDEMNAIWPIMMVGDRQSGMRKDLDALRMAFPAMAPSTPALDQFQESPLLLLGGVLVTLGAIVIARFGHARFARLRKAGEPVLRK